MRSLLTAAGVSLAFTLFLTPVFIRLFEKWGWGQVIRTPENVHNPSHGAKRGTPTMGGTIFILGAVVGYLSLWSVYWLFKLVTGKEGMGHGDFKLLAALGAWCGVSAILPIVMISSVVGAIIGSAWLLIQGRDRATQIPFGPYLAIAGWIHFILGIDLLALFLRWLAPH